MPGINLEGLVSRESLTALVNEIKDPHTFYKMLLFSNTDPRPTNVLRFDVIVGDRQIAPFVKRNGEAIEVTPFTEKTITVEPPNIRIKRHLDPDELLIQRRAGEPIFFGDQSEVLSGAERHIARTSRRLNDLVTEAEEYLCAQAVRGTISYEVDGEEAFELVFPRSSSHSVTASDRWDTSAGAPISDFLEAKELISTDAGLPVTHCILGKEATTAFLGNAQVKDFLDNRRIEAGSLELNRQFAASGAIRLGMFEDVEVWSYPRKTNLPALGGGGGDTTLTSFDLTRPKYAEFVCATADAENVLEYGVITDIRAMEARQFQAARFSKSWQQEDPSVWWQLVTSRPLPIMRRPDSTVSMLVAT